MRWEALFADLEAQLDAAEAAEQSAEVADRTRLERARVWLIERLRAAADHRLVLRLEAGEPLDGVLVDTGPDWLLLAAGSREWVVPLRAVLSLEGLSSAAATEVSVVAARFDLRHALRGVARDRSAVSVLVRDGSWVSGTLDRVAADHVDVAEHPRGESRRAGAVTAVRTVPLAAVVAVRRD